MLNNDGKNIAFLLDEFDELPEELQSSGIIASLLNRRLLPECGIVISSRSHATIHFHESVLSHVDILGFSVNYSKVIRG